MDFHGHRSPVKMKENVDQICEIDPELCWFFVIETGWFVLC